VSPTSARRERRSAAREGLWVAVISLI
jgi:hypothetical protein